MDRWIRFVTCVFDVWFYYSIYVYNESLQWPCTQAIYPVPLYPGGHTFQGSLNWQLFPCWWICRPIDNSLSIPSTFADSPIWENAGVAFIIPFLSWIPQNVEVKTDQLCPASVTPYFLHSPSSRFASQLDLLTAPTWPHRGSMQYDCGNQSFFLAIDTRIIHPTLFSSAYGDIRIHEDIMGSRSL
jgi:hypothetical protein